MPTVVRRGVAFIVWLIFLAVLAEGGSYVYGSRFYPRAEPPDYRIPEFHGAPGQTSYVPGLRTEEKPWGSWRHSNVAVAQQTPCFRVTYRTNSYGARDDERPRRSAGPRVLMLGDSFAEGYGVDKRARASDVLERELGVPVLNFGEDGYFGPLQYRILYERLASSFDHSVVLVMVLAANDFTDNWYPYWRTLGEQMRRRYRPYYGSCGTDACPMYPTSAPRGGLEYFQPVPFGDLPPAQKLALIWQHYSWTWSTYKALQEIASPIYQKSADYAGYRDPTQPQIRAVISSLARIRELAGSRPMVVALIPRPNDIAAMRASAAPLPVPAAFAAAARTYGFTFVDLAKPMLAREPDVAKWFLTCDGHWSATGQRLAADVLREPLAKLLPARARGR